MPQKSYIERYNEGAICVDCCSDMVLGQPCQHCIDERNAAIAAGVIKASPELPGLPELTDMPENAGRHAAPSLTAPTTIPPTSEELTERIRDLHLLRTRYRR